jgi:hypothetical protein
MSNTSHRKAAKPPIAYHMVPPSKLLSVFSVVQGPSRDIIRTG